MHFGSRMENKSRECVFTRKKRRHGKKQSKSTYYLFPLSYPRLNGENKPRCANSEIPPALIVADPLSRSDSVPNFVPSRFPGSIIAFVGSPLFSIPLYVLSVRLKQWFAFVHSSCCSRKKSRCPGKRQKSPFYEYISPSLLSLDPVGERKDPFPFDTKKASGVATAFWPVHAFLARFGEDDLVAHCARTIQVCHNVQAWVSGQTIVLYVTAFSLPLHSHRRPFFQPYPKSSFTPFPILEGAIYRLFCTNVMAGFSFIWRYCKQDEGKKENRHISLWRWVRVSGKNNLEPFL